MIESDAEFISPAWDISSAPDSKASKRKPVRWTHFQVDESNCLIEHPEFVGLDELLHSIITAPTVRPRFLEKENGVILILTTTVASKQLEEPLASVRFWITRDDIISVSVSKFIEQTLIPIRDSLIQRSNATVISVINEVIDVFTSRLVTQIDELEEQLSAAEKIVATREVNDACLNLSMLRVHIADLRRYMMPQRDALEKLMVSKSSQIQKSDRPRLIEAHDLSARIFERLNDLRDRAIIINDEIENLRDRQLNRRTYTFTLIATIFLPLSFLTGLLGMNIGGIPATDLRSAFWIFTIACCVLIAAQIYILRRRNLL